MKDHTCCFLGHRKIIETKELIQELTETIKKLITDKDVDTFLFGSKSSFDDLCLEIVTKLKEDHPHIKRVYVRAEYPDISDDYKAYLLKRYEQTYYPADVLGAGKAVYIERNYEMINKSRYCIFYYDEKCAPTARKSGCKLALEYARKQHKEIMVFSHSTL